MSQLELKHVGKVYGHVSALDGLNLTVPAGCRFVLVGPSGCGKSTTLRLVAGLDRPDAGSICIEGKSVLGTPPRQRNVAMVFQHGALYPHLNVLDNLRFPLRMRRVGRDERERRVREVAALLEIDDLGRRRPDELSGGQRQRVALGKAIVCNPSIFLLDEPLTDLDAPLRDEMQQVLVTLQQKTGTTMLLVTHDQREAMAVAEQLAVMFDGRIQQTGTPEQIYDNPNSAAVAQFFGTPTMHIWPAAITTDHRGASHLQLAGRDYEESMVKLPNLGSQPVAAASRPVLVGLRPEHVSLTEGSGLVPWECDVLQIQSMGYASIVYLNAPGGLPLAARLPPLQSQPGENLTLHVDLRRLHYFDADSQARL